MEPYEVERWLSSLGTLIPREALAALSKEVRAQQMDGAQFARLVASRAMPALGDAVRPSHMATLRRCWTSSFGSSIPPPSVCSSGMHTPAAAGPPGTQSIRNGLQTRAVSASSIPGAALFDDRRNGHAASNGATGRVRPPAAPEAASMSSASNAFGDRSRHFAPPPRTTSAADVAYMDRVRPAMDTVTDNIPEAQDVLSDPGSVDAMSPGGYSTDASPQTGFLARSQTGASQVQRPPQVPRLDLSSIHGEARKAQGAPLNVHDWMDAKQRSSAHSRPAPGARVSQQGFAAASSQDKQRIAEFYGYRDEGFTTTMSALRTDMVRPRLYVGNMADAAYLPLLQSIDCAYVLNCAMEAQKAPPPYPSDGIKYLMLPLYDSVDQTQQLIRQRFRALKEATKFIHTALKSRRQGGAVLVHCVQGLSRSAAIICAYLMEYEGMSLEKAIADVRTKHPGCLTAHHWQNLLHKYNAELLRGC